MADGPEEIDMAMSLVMAPQAQNHDRHHPDDHAADDSHDSDEWVDEDAMDLSPDSTAVLPPPTHQSSPHSPRSPTSPPAQNHSQSQGNEENHEPNITTNNGGGSSAGTNVSTNEDNDHDDEDDGTDESTSEEDYDEEYDDDSWHEIQEDHSEPDEQELKEIKDEVSAVDHTHFEAMLQKDFEYPEYRLASTGRIDWSIDHYNGTREAPNRELLMKSPIVRVGGYDWQIKFYPRGNDSVYLSIYVDCISIPHENVKENEKERSKSKSSRNAQKNSTPSIATATPAKPAEPQSTPLPMLHGKQYPKRESVAAQVIVVLYNPSEPRTFYHRSGLHRFCPLNPDWGWTRFHGPFSEIGLRQRLQRQPLLRDDKLALTAYIRTADDDTSCLWEHTTKENPWDCFGMTGMQGLMGPPLVSRAYVPAVASWLLLKPFRKLLYDIETRDEEFEQISEPLPVVAALQKILYDFRTLPMRDKDNWRRPVDLQPLCWALNQAGLMSFDHKCDVIEAWETIRFQLEQELKHTTYSNRMKDIFGPERYRSTSMQRKHHSGTYKVSVKGVASIQEAMNQSKNFLDRSLAPPLLHIELDRQEFDSSSRSWKKLLNKISINDYITWSGKGYTLFGIITHQDDLQSGNYSALLRPNGPRTSWFQFTEKKPHLDGREEKVLTRLPEKLAIQQHEGFNGRGDDSKPVAYIVLYIRNDEAQSQFDAKSEPNWSVSDWLLRSTENRGRKLTPAIGEKVDPKKKSKKAPEKSNEKVNVLVKAINSTAFAESNTSKTGIIGFWPNEGLDKWTKTFTIPLSSKALDISKKLSTMYNIDHRRIKVFGMSPYGKDEFPRIEYHGEASPFGYISENEDIPEEIERWLLFHILSEEELKGQLKAAEAASKKEKPPSGSASTPVVGSSNSNSQPRPSRAENLWPVNTNIATNNPDDDSTNANGNAITGEDTVMSEAEEDRVISTIRAAGQAIFDLPPHVVDHAYNIPPFVPPSHDAAGSSSASRNGLPLPPPPPPAPGGLIPPPPIFTMPVALETLPPPPPGVSLRRAFHDAPMRPPTKERDIYFFLKTWDPEKQLLEPIGMFYARGCFRVDQVVHKILKVPKEPHLAMFHQLNTWTIDSIKRRKTFDDLRITNGSVIVAQITLLDPDVPSAEEKLTDLLERAGFADLAGYIRSQAKDCIWPWRHSADDAVLDYFGQESYIGALRNHEPHGAGAKVYFNGDTYTGAFALGRRHGAGRMVYVNGDSYEGEWVRDLHDGRGRYVEGATLNTYEGGWREGRRFGEGVTHWKKAEVGEKVCRVCWVEPLEAAFFDCGHVAACLGCARSVDVCLVCRKKVLSALKLYPIA
jgi:hypothetical protein